MFSFVSYLAVILSFVFVFPSVGAFSFSYSQAPTQCDDLTITWTGGTPPFQLSLLHLFGTQNNISIPASAFSNGKGSYTVPIQLAAKERMLIMMSDATGANSGGTTGILNVGPPIGGRSCNTTDPGTAFIFKTPNSLVQCQSYSFTDYTGAIQPVTITAIVPGGNVFTLSPPVGPTSFSWQSNVARGTTLVFIMNDSQGRQGGITDANTATSSSDTSCLDSNSPSSTAFPPTTPTSSSGPTSTSGTSPSAKDGFSIAAIAGTVIGALIFLALAITLGLFFLRKTRNDDTSNFRRHSRVVDPAQDLTYRHSESSRPHFGVPATGNVELAPSPYPYSRAGVTTYPSDPFLDSNNPSNQASTFDAASMYTDAQYAQSEVGRFENHAHYQYGAPSQQAQIYPPTTARTYPSTSASTSFDPYGTLSPPQQYSDLDSSRQQQHTRSQSQQSQAQSQTSPQGSSIRTSLSTTAAQRKAAAAGATAYKPSRYIVHTDVDDLPPPAEEEEIIELPPQYSERRAPAPQAPPPSTSRPNADAGHTAGEESLLPYS